MIKKTLWDDGPSDYDNAINDLIERGVGFGVERINGGEHILRAEDTERKFDKKGALMSEEQR